MKSTSHAVDHFQSLFNALRAVPPAESDRGVRDGLNAVSHLLDRESLLKMRRLVAERWPDSASLAIIDRALARFGREGNARTQGLPQLCFWIVSSVASRIIALVPEVPFSVPV